jgi:O-acetyl-ADP-ribose deacetylase (regulator of RNase III)
MTLRYVTGDLFTADKDCALAHCISSDYAMGAGIAKAFTKMGVKDAIIKLCGTPTVYSDKRTDRWENIGYCIPVTVNGRRIFNLVTKERYWQKPTLKTMAEALDHMKKHISFTKCTKIAMPRIGCGLDKLQWADVEQLIQKTFEGTDIEIIVYSL